jgi:hypothetical protein
MPIKKPVIISIIIVLFLQIFSGCTFLNSTEFRLISQTIGDDNGFPSLSIRFNTTGMVTVRISGPSGIMHEETFFKGIHDAILHLDSHRHTPKGGEYFLHVFDENENKIFENQMTFSDPNLDITNAELLWWNEGDSLSLVGVQISAMNRGDLPLYPDEIIVDAGPFEVTGLALPIVMLPNQDGNIDACLYYTGVSTASRIVDISVESKSDIVLGTISESIQPVDNVNELVFSWRYKGSQMFRVPELSFLHEYYQGLERFLTDDYGTYVFDLYDEAYIDLIADQLKEKTNTLDIVESVNYIASFVQDIRYATDDDIDPTCTEYPRFPVELLTDGQGDCEDKAILAASILDKIGYEVALIRLPNHMAVGVHLSEDATAFDYYIDEYYYLETTRNRWIVGKVPDDYVGLTNASAYAISTRPVLLHTWDDATRYTTSDGSDYVRIKIIIENIGSGAALNFDVQGAFYTSTNQSRNPNTVIVYGLEPGVKEEVRLEMDVPQGVTTILRTQLVMDDVVVHEKESTSTFP